MHFAIRFDSDARRRHLGWLFLLRGILVVLLLIAGQLTSWFQQVHFLHDSSLDTAFFLFIMFNVFSFWRLRQLRAVSELELFIQLLADVLLMSWIFYRTGGASNPFVSWYLVPLAISASILHMRYTVALAFLTFTAYSILIFYYVPFAPFSGFMAGQHGGGLWLLGASGEHLMLSSHEQMMESAQPDFNLHILGMWLNFVVSASIITFFVSRMSLALRDQDKKLADQQQRILQREQVVALGALAAGAAHELGTPLSTMSILAKDIEQDLPESSSLREEMGLLRKQLSLCRNILGELRKQADEPTRLSLESYAVTLMDRVSVLYPDRQIMMLGAVPACTIIAPAVLQQVLVNLLDNGLHASHQKVGVSIIEEGDSIVFSIEDDGDGIAPDILPQLGQAFISSKEEGLGLGYFLGHVSVNQLGGSIHFQRLEKGTCTELRLPWSALQRESL
jgi:two-component system sensor histidine kinase RegB